MKEETASLCPADISASIRHIVRNQKNYQTLLGEVTGIDVANRTVNFKNGSARYNYLILGAGATRSYFGHDDWVPFAPGLKNLDDAVEMRRRILLAFEDEIHRSSGLGGLGRGSHHVPGRFPQPHPGDAQLVLELVD